MSLTTRDKQVLARKGYEDPVFFNKTFLPHIFSKDPPWIHRGLLSILTGMTKFLLRYGEVSNIVRNFSPIFRALADGGEVTSPDEIDERAARGTLTLEICRKQRLALIMPRGISKTMLAGVSVPLRETLYRDIPFFVYVSETANHAKMQLDNVKRELESNEAIIEIFGEMKPELRDPERWASDMFETKHGIVMVARGRGGQIRGLNHRGNRPRKIVCDDLEDKESVETEYQRQKTRRWAYGDLLPAIEKVNFVGELDVLGTLLDKECLLNTFKADPTFNCVEFGAKDMDGELLWPDWMDEDRLESEKQAAAQAGELETYYLEYFSQATTSETNPFRKFKHKYISEWELLAPPAIYCDPAISEKETADEAVILVAGMTKNGTIVVLDGVGDRGMTPRDIIDEYFRLSILHRCLVHGVESIAYQAALVHLLREEMFRKKHYFEVLPVTNSKQKVRRIMGIVYPRYASGYIAYAKPMPKLETQLYDFQPKKREQRDDWADCLAGVTSLLDPYAAAGIGDGVPLDKDQYEDLPDWRWA